MDVKFSQNNCCGEGAVSASERTKKLALYDSDPEIVGSFGRPKETECFGKPAMNILNSPRKRRTQAGRTLKAGRDQE